MKFKRPTTRKDPKIKQFNVRLTVSQMREMYKFVYDRNISKSKLVYEMLIANKVISPSEKLFS